MGHQDGIGEWAREDIETSDAAIMKQFKSSPYWRLFKLYIQKELDAIETAGWKIGQDIDKKEVTMMELLRYQRSFIKGLLDLPEKLIAMDFTQELAEQDQINTREIEKLM